MLWFLIPLLIIVVIICYLLLAPFYLEIDSEQRLFRVRFDRLAVARLEISDSTIIVDVWVAGWRKRIDLLATKEKKAPQKIKPIKKQEPKKKVQHIMSRVVAMVKSFEVKECYLNIDTRDMSWNGILYPMFYGLSRRTGKELYINFVDKNELRLTVRNNIARIGYAYFFHHKE